MKKCTKIILLFIIFMLFTITLVNAADATATLNLSKSEVKNGDIFIVTLNVSCEEGINGLLGTISYDEAKLDLVSLQVGDITKWSNLGEGLDVAILHITKETITSADILKMTFKVKDTAEAGTTAKVSVSDLSLDSDEATDSTKELGKKEIGVTIKEKNVEEPQEKTLTSIRIKRNPTKVTYVVGEKFDKTGLIVEAEYSDGTSKEITDFTYEPTGKLKLTDEKITITYTEGEVTKTLEQSITVKAVPQDNKTEEDGKTGDKETDKGVIDEGKKDDTQADKNITYAGLEDYAFLIISIVAIIGYISYKKYQQYKNI